MNSAIIVAGGSGKRMNSATKKQYIYLNEKPILSYTIAKFENCDEIDEIILVVPKEDIEFVKENIVEKEGFKKLSAVVEGGKERQNSVYNGLKRVSEDCDLVLIHDGVRPFVKDEEIKRVIESAKKFDACVLGVKVKDTIKICDEIDCISHSPDRKTLWAAHTPQAFSYELILTAYNKAFEDGFYGTDDAMLAERLGFRVKMVEGSYDNIKITTPEDLEVAKLML